LSKLIFRTIVFLLLGMLTMANHARAQEFNAYFGLGSATNSAGTTPGCGSKFIFDNFTGNCAAAPTMGGLFGVFGADYMFSPHRSRTGRWGWRREDGVIFQPASVRQRHRLQQPKLLLRERESFSVAWRSGREDLCAAEYFHQATV
jgi:hypothetical protein